jgi:RNA polymerase sigma factor (TIGR02999 family)
MADLTQLLERWSRGDREAFDALVPLVYEELRGLAEVYLQNERPGHTLQPTALVHEAYVRLSATNAMRLENRAHFFGAAARAMRRVLVDHARRRSAGKRGGAHQPSLTVEEAAFEVPFDVLALNDALERLASVAPEKAQVVELRYFGGLSVDEVGHVLGLSATSVKRHWAFGRAWLLRALT